HRRDREAVAPTRWSIPGWLTGRPGGLWSGGKGRRVRRRPVVTGRRRARRRRDFQRVSGIATTGHAGAPVAEITALESGGEVASADAVAGGTLSATRSIPFTSSDW